MPAMARRASPSQDSDDGDDDGDWEDEEGSRLRSSSPTEGKSEEFLLRSGAASGAESSGADALFTEIRREGGKKKAKKKKKIWKSKMIEEEEESSSSVAVAGAKR